MGTISIVIPCFRDSKTLGRALDSVFAQTRRADEVVVVNDCSPEKDEIEDILRKYPEVVYVRNEVNVGLAASRNIGIEKSTCEIVSFLDADDELHPQKIEFQAAVLRRNAAVSCANRRIGGEEKPVPDRKYTSIGHIREFTESSGIIYRNKLTGASMMACKEDLKRVGGYDPSLRSCEDYDLWLRLLDSGFVALHITRPLYLYRHNINGLSRNTSSISHWEMEVIKKALGRKNFLPPFQGKAATVWSFWILKHILRNRTARSENLLVQINQNMNMLAHSAPQKIILKAIRAILRPKK